MKPLSPSCSPSNKRSFFSIYLITISFIVFVTILYAKDFTCTFQHAIFQASPQQLELDQQAPTEAEKGLVMPFAIGKAEECDVFAGTWVYDEVSRPQYEESACPYIPPQLACQAHGRPDKGYQHWRWQPHGCSLPSFNATFMLEKLRGKRMMFVGDSLSRGHFMSMVCLLHQAIPKTAKPLETNGSLTLFRAEEYNTSVGFYWAPFLVESNADDPVIHKVTSRIVRTGAINKHAKHWKGVDIVVFNTYLWWMTRLKLNILRGPFDGDMKDMRHMETQDAYRLVLRRMVRWVEKNIDPQKTRVFFNTMSPLHEWGRGWGGEGSCYNETRPITDPTYWGVGSIKGMMRVVGEVLGKAKVPITLLNTTQLSEYRKDAHTSVYREFFNSISPEQRANPRSFADCVHWCLPGLPDTWNEILYTKLFFP